MEGVPEFLARERIAPGEVRGACQASTHFDNTAGGTKNSTNIYVQSVSKKMSFLGKIAISTFKLIQNAKVGGVLENSGYLLPDGH